MTSVKGPTAHRRQPACVLLITSTPVCVYLAKRYGMAALTLMDATVQRASKLSQIQLETLNNITCEDSII